MCGQHRGNHNCSECLCVSMSVCYCGVCSITHAIYGQRTLCDTCIQIALLLQGKDAGSPREIDDIVKKSLAVSHMNSN